jgi:hypothetical protein
MRLTTTIPHSCIEFEFNDDIHEKHLRDKALEHELLTLSRLFDENEYLKRNWDKIVIVLHHKSRMRITSKFTPGYHRVTNAFMKMLEFVRYIQIKRSEFFKVDKLSMFDIAGAPGMFVFAAEYVLPGVELDWKACSLSAEEDKSFKDVYDLYKNNKERYQDCDVTNEEDVKKILENGKFRLVTGDIGMPHDDDFSKLQEENQMDVQWGQMVLAINLVEEGGICFLKMYTYAFRESVLIVDILSTFFEKLEIVKPYASRIVNDESYIICYNRNDKVSEIPLTRKYAKWKSNSREKLTEFDILRNKEKMLAVNNVMQLLVFGDKFNFGMQK